MKRPCLVCIFIFLFGALTTVNGQEYFYRHFGIKEGLAGNHVYHQVQGAEGFLWFATETGVSRYDGTSFKNFTTADGLPDNEILYLFLDSKGRVWMLPFNNTLCYYYKGKIHNAGNDSLLKKIKPLDYVWNIFEGKDGEIYIIGRGGINVITKDNRLLIEDSYKGKTNWIQGGGLNHEQLSVVYMDTSFYALTLTQQGIKFEKKDYDYRFHGFKVTYFHLDPNLLIYLDNYKNQLEIRRLIIHNFKSNSIDTMSLPEGFNNISFLNDSILFFNTKNGSFAYDHIAKKFLNHYLPEENVSFTNRDIEGNLWFATIDHGIYRLSSDKAINIQLKGVGGKGKPLETIFNTPKYILAGSDNNQIYQVDKKTAEVRQFQLKPSVSSGAVIKIKRYNDQLYILTEGILQKSDTTLNNISALRGTEVLQSFKDFDIRKDGTLFFSTSGMVFSYVDSSENQNNQNFNARKKKPEQLNYGEFSKLNKFYTGRSTAICCVDSGIYIGTVEGLNFINWDKKITRLGATIPALNRRITKLLVASDKIWIGTNDAGLVCFDGKKVIKTISVNNGLTSNLIRAIYADNNYLYAGTDRGVNKISLRKSTYPVVQTYTGINGLANEMINAIYAQNESIFIGTPEGLIILDDHKTKVNSICDLKILGITTSGKTFQFDSSRIELGHRDNNIRFDFVAISFKSEGDITYYYQLSGIDIAWKTTKENFLQYPTLPSGEYSMMLYAVNKFGVKSKAETIKFSIEKTLLEETWFIILMGLSFVLLTVLIARQWIKKIKMKQDAKMANAEKILHLEQQALKAQMNPHFIFNCLNSIQQYVIDKDIRGANKFISGFSKLIRQTLDNSGRQVITVAEEESFLRNYLELEKGRFEDKFDFEITIDKRINIESDSFPPMLLQPYIENSIRHGIMHKSNGRGVIKIDFQLISGNLVCSVTDNGIGRMAAEAFKGLQSLSYKSKGTQLTGQRIKMMNKNKVDDIILKTEDLMDEYMQPAGTKVTILIPLQNQI